MMMTPEQQMQYQQYQQQMQAQQQVLPPQQAAQASMPPPGQQQQAAAAQQQQQLPQFTQPQQAMPPQQPQQALQQQALQQQQQQPAQAPQPGGAPAPPAAAAAAAQSQEEALEQRRQEDALLEKARLIQAEWQRRALAYGPRHEDPMRPLTHWDFFLKEAHWLARDFGQERLWKRRAAYHVAHAAAAEGRRRLAVAAAAREAAAKSSSTGRGSKAKKEEAEQQHREQQLLLGVLDMSQPELSVPLEDLLYWANDGEFTQCVVAHLENSDVTKLLRHYQYNQRCDADLEVAWLQAENRAAEERKAEAQPGEDELAAKRGKRKGAKPRPDMDDGDDEAVPMAGGRPHPAYASRDKRKRKAREYDDDDYVAGNKGNRALDPRARLAAGAAGGMARSGSDMSLQPGGDPRMHKRLKGHQMGMDASGRLHPHQLAQRPSGLARSASVGVPHNWGYDDDALLTALVVEYGFNWHFIADTCSSTCVLQGVTRRSEWCKQRYQQIKQAGEAAAAEPGGALGPDGQPLDGAGAGIANLVNLTKQQAKELVMRSLPVPESVLKRHADAITPVSAKKKTQMIQDRDAVRKQNATLQEPHMSHFKLTQQALAQSGGRILNPLEITEQEEAARRALQRQQEIERAQLAAQQQAAAQQAAQQQAAAAAAAAAQQQMQAQMQQQAAGGMQQMAMQQQQQQQMAAAMAQGMGRAGSLTNPLLPQGSNAAAQAAAAAAQQRGGAPGAMAARGPSSSGLTPEQQMMLMQQQQQQQAAMAAQQQQRTSGSGQAQAAQQQQQGAPPAAGMQAASPGQQQAAMAQQQRQVQQYAQQQAQQQLMAQRMAGFPMQGAAAAAQAQMAAAQAGQLQQANSGQLQQAGSMQGMMWPQMQLMQQQQGGNPAVAAAQQQQPLAAAAAAQQQQQAAPGQLPPTG